MTPPESKGRVAEKAVPRPQGPGQSPSWRRRLLLVFLLLFLLLFLFLLRLLFLLFFLLAVVLLHGVLREGGGGEREGDGNREQQCEQLLHGLASPLWNSVRCTCQTHVHTNGMSFSGVSRSGRILAKTGDKQGENAGESFATVQNLVREDRWADAYNHRPQ